jgi:hypothetical protein
MMDARKKEEGRGKKVVRLLPSSSFLLPRGMEVVLP